MFVVGLVSSNQRQSSERHTNTNDASMSFNQDMNFHRYMNSTATTKVFGAHSKDHRPLYHNHRFASPQRLLSCPNESNGSVRFKSTSTLSLDSIVSPSETSTESVQCSSCSSHSSPTLDLSSQTDSTTSVINTSESSLCNSFITTATNNVESGPAEGASTASPSQPSPQTPNNNNHSSNAHNSINKTSHKHRNKSRHRHHHPKSKSSEAKHLELFEEFSDLKPKPNASNNSANWYQFLLPSYRSRLTQFQSTFLDIPTTEKLVDDYMCALHKEILLQGRLYVAVNYIAFYSNILGYETVVSINYREVKSISKATTIKLFPNAIQVVTNSNDKYFFTSFVSRERAYKTMRKLWMNATSQEEEHRFPWTEVCKLIRDSYDTGTLDNGLMDLEHVDLGPNMLKGKNIRKRLKLKKVKSEPVSSSLQRSGSLTSLSYESCAEEDEIDCETANSDQTLQLTYDQVDGSMTSGRSVLRSLFVDRSERTIKWCVDMVGSFMVSLPRTKESVLTGLVITLVVVLLLTQLGIYMWMVSIDQRVERFQNTIEHLSTQQTVHFDRWYRGNQLFASFSPPCHSTHTSAPIDNISSTNLR